MEQHPKLKLNFSVPRRDELEPTVDTIDDNDPSDDYTCDQPGSRVLDIAYFLESSIKRKLLVGGVVGGTAVTGFGGGLASANRFDSPSPYTRKDHAAQCMNAAMRFDTDIDLIKRPHIKQGYRSMRVRVSNSPIRTIDASSSTDTSTCDELGGESIKIAYFMENDKGKVVIDSEWQPVVEHSNRLVYDPETLHLKREYTCERGPGNRIIRLEARKTATFEGQGTQKINYKFSGWDIMDKDPYC